MSKLKTLITFFLSLVITVVVGGSLLIGGSRLYQRTLNHKYQHNNASIDATLTVKKYPGLKYPDDPEKAAFLAKAAYIAHDVAIKNHVLPSIMVAQAITESKWGTSELSAKYYNYFGVKYTAQDEARDKGEDPKKARDDMYNTVKTKPKKLVSDKWVIYPTTEGSGEDAVTVYSKFSRYKSMRDSFNDNAYTLRHVRFTKDSPYYYRGAWTDTVGLTPHSYIKAAKSLQHTYSTDPNYASNLIGIIEKYKLYKLDTPK